MKKMKLWRWFKKCPMLFLLLAGWGSLTAYTWSQGRLPHRLEKDISAVRKRCIPVHAQ